MGNYKVRIMVVPADPAKTITIVETEPTLRNLQRLIGGGYIEAIGTAEWTGYVDEDGNPKGLPVNRRAMDIARLAEWRHNDWLVGDAIFLGPPDARDGIDTDVPSFLIGIARMLGKVEIGEVA